jgi:hypothetical protein
VRLETHQYATADGFKHPPWTLDCFNGFILLIQMYFLVQESMRKVIDRLWRDEIPGRVRRNLFARGMPMKSLSAILGSGRD